MLTLPGYVLLTLNVLATLFVVVVGIVSALVVGTLLVDVIQTKDAVRRNFPVIGRFRDLFSRLGEFFRQYFFAMDREEMPFNRAEREWVYRAAKNLDNTVAFGSTKNLNPPGTVIFVNCPFPAAEDRVGSAREMTIGPYCRHPYAASSFFNISAMSFGALSAPAVRALSRGAKLAGCWLNTGEGGLAPYHLEGACDLVFQIGTAKYGVRDTAGALNENKLGELAARTEIRMFEIKLSQGAKPGKGGILPGEKVTQEIAKIRGIPVAISSISPNRHAEISSVGSLLDFLTRVRTLTGKPVGFKTVIGAYGWLEMLCEEVQHRGIESAPDFITLDGGDGGSGAAPMPLMDNVGLSIRESLPIVDDVLTRFGLRDRVRLIASGKLVTPSEAAWALCAGADFVTSARGFMFSLGCIQALRCNKNSCPTGITTHRRRLQRGLDPQDKAVRVASYCKHVIGEVEMIAHSCGVDGPRELRRHHARIVQANGRSVPMDELYPYPLGAARAVEPPGIEPTVRA